MGRLAYLVEGRPCCGPPRLCATLCASWRPTVPVPTPLPLPCHASSAPQGHGRSAVTAAAILMAMGKADTADEALAKVVKVNRVG